MSYLLRKLLKKAKTYVILNKKIVPEKSNVNLIQLKILDDISIPSSSSLPFVRNTPPVILKRQSTVQELDQNLEKLRTTLSSKEKVPTYIRNSYNATPPQIYENLYSGNASSTVSEEESEEYLPIRTRKPNIIRKISSKQKRFSTPSIKTYSGASIEGCYSQNSERFRLSKSFLPSIPIEEDALSLMDCTTPLPDPMQPILSCYH